MNLYRFKPGIFGPQQTDALNDIAREVARLSGALPAMSAEPSEYPMRWVKITAVDGSGNYTATEQYFTPAGAFVDATNAMAWSPTGNILVERNGKTVSIFPFYARATMRSLVSGVVWFDFTAGSAGGIEVLGRTGDIAAVTKLTIDRGAVTGTGANATFLHDDASATLPGDVNLIAQSFEGAKTFLETLTVNTATPGNGILVYVASGGVPRAYLIAGTLGCQIGGLFPSGFTEGINVDPAIHAIGLQANTVYFQASNDGFNGNNSISVNTQAQRTRESYLSINVVAPDGTHVPVTVDIISATATADARFVDTNSNPITGMNLYNPSALPIAYYIQNTRGGTGTVGGLVFSGGLYISGSPTSSLAVGTTPITGGVDGDFLYQTAGKLAEYTPAAADAAMGAAIGAIADGVHP